jgi:cytochrome P450
MAAAFVKRLESHIESWLGSAPVLRTLFADARAVSPILVVGARALVTSFAGVTEILTHPSFGVKEVYAARMERTTGAFFLGMDPGPQYDREATLARRAVRPGDLETVRAIARESAATLIDEARSEGTIDAVAGFSRIIPIRIVQRFFGVPGPNDADLMRWMRTLFWEIFLNWSNDATIAAAADASSSELGPYLRDLIESRKRERAAGAPGDDFLRRLVDQQGQPDGGFDDDGIRRNIGGIIVGAVDTQSKAIAQALEQLLKRPSALEVARLAVRAGDDALLSAAVFEALRFNPLNPVLPRVCQREVVLGENTRHAKTIPQGTFIFAATLGAMFDGAAIDAPDEFRTERPPTDYLHFGLGVHRCFGERFNDVVLPEAIKAILSLPGLRLDGALQYDGPFPEHLKLRFDA